MSLYIDQHRRKNSRMRGHPYESTQGGYGKKVAIVCNCSSLREDTSYHSNIITGMSQLYGIDCTYKGIFRVGKYESEKKCSKFQDILNSNAIKSNKIIVTKRVENYKRSEEISSATTLNSSDISFIDNLKNTRLGLESGWEVSGVPSCQFY